MTAQALAKPVQRSSSLHFLLTTVLGSVFLALASQVAVPLPFTTVPFTLQTVAIFLLGITLDPKRGLASVLLYLTEGAIGLPVFCLGNGGFLCLIGLGGGWLLAFAPAVWLVGTLYQRLTFNPNLRILVACLAGEGVIFLGGLLWIAMLSGGETALILADLTLLLPGLLKIALVVSASPLLNKVRL